MLNEKNGSNQLYLLPVAINFCFHEKKKKSWKTFEQTFRIDSDKNCSIFHGDIFSVAFH